jgi:hypothetical protein
MGILDEWCNFAEKVDSVLLRCIGGSRRWHNQKGKSAGLAEEKGDEKKK